MRLILFAGLLLIAAPLRVSADTIPNPTVNGQVVGDCPAINGTVDCQRAMTAATAVCKEYGFRSLGRIGNAGNMGIVVLYADMS
jgi:hypothetical protein